MTCQECELALAAGENPDHLAGCSACRALAEEMRANAAAFELFADDALPSVRYKVMAQVRSQSAARQVLRWGWALAAAAMLVIGIGVIRSQHEEVMPRAQIAHVGPPPIENRTVFPSALARVQKNTTGAPLMVKMLTSDPNVVIYWQIESEDGEK